MDNKLPRFSYVDASGVALTGADLSTAETKTSETLDNIIMIEQIGAFGADGSEYLVAGETVYGLVVNGDDDQVLHPWMIATGYRFYFIINGDGDILFDLDDLSLGATDDLPATLISLDIDGAGSIIISQAHAFPIEEPDMVL